MKIQRITAILFITLLTLSAYPLTLRTQAAEPGSRFFNAALSPTSVNINQNVRFTLQVTNDPASQDNIGSINITIPLGFTGVTHPVITSPSGNWITNVQTETKIGMKPSSPQESLPPGRTLSITFFANTPALPGVSTWKTECTTNTGIGGISFTLSSGAQQPVVFTNPALVAPSINAFPSVLNQGQATSLTSSTVTTGSPPYTFQWLTKSPAEGAYSPVHGGTSPSYTFLTDLSTTIGTWNFLLRVTDSTGATVTSSKAASVLVNPALTAPLVTASPSVIVQGQDSSLTSSGVVTGTAPYAYQWFQKSPYASGFIPLEGALSSNHIFQTTDSTVTGEWSFTLRVTDATGASVTSNTVEITVNPRKYVITASAGPNGVINPSGSIHVNRGTDQVFTITPNDGYHVADVLVDGVSAGPIPHYTFTSIAADHTISASFIADTSPVDTFTITVIQGNNGVITPGTTVVSYGDTPTFTFTPNTGYKIDQVFVDGSPIVLDGYDQYTFPPVSASHVITATFLPEIRVIVASAGANGAINPNGNVVVNYGATQTFTITAAPHHRILDVAVDGISVGPVTSYTFTNVAANHTIQASFERSEFPIIASAGPNGRIDPSGTIYVSFNSNQTFTFTPAAGYRVADVRVDGNSVGAPNSYTFNNVVNGHVIEVTFAINVYPVYPVYTIVASAGSGGSITPSGSVPVNHGADASFTITANLGYRITDIVIGGSISLGPQNSSYTYTFTNVQANNSIRAIFTVNTYTITASSDARSTISPSGTIPVTHGSTQTFTYTANPGYTVTSVLVDGAPVATSGSYTFSNIQTSHTITVSTTINNYTITATASTGGTINPSGRVTVNYGADQAFTIKAASGYHIEEVFVNGISVGAIDSYAFIGVVADHTIHANFAVNRYTLTVLSPYGSPTPSSLVVEGADFTASVTSPHGDAVHRWICIGYRIDGGPVEPGTSYTFVNVQANHTITFIWQEQYYVTIVSSDGATAQSGWYNVGTTMTASVPSGVIPGDDGTRQVFSGWSGDASGTGLNSNPIEIDGPKTVTANWKTQYYLTVISAHGATDGEGWYDAGTTAYARVSPLTVDGSAGTQYLFTGWSGDALGSTSSSNAITMDGPKKATANWKTQYYLTVISEWGNPTGQGWYDAGTLATFSVSTPVSNSRGVRFVLSRWIGTEGGYSGSEASSTVVMNGPTAKQAIWTTQYQVVYAVSGNALQVTLPPTEWVNSGASATGKFTQSRTNMAGDTRCNYIGDNRTAVVTEPITVTATYRTEYIVAFSQDGMGTDALGTILTAFGQKRTLTNIADVLWVNSGDSVSFSFAEIVKTSDSDKEYILKDVNATSPVTINGPILIQATYEKQASISLSTIALSALLLLALALLALLLLARRRKKKITPFASEGGSISPSTVQKVKPGGDSPTFQFAAKAGYEIADVVIDRVKHLGTVESHQFKNVTANHVISASFRKI